MEKEWPDKFGFKGFNLGCALSDAGVDPSGNNGHSFRICAATTTARMGVKTHLYRLWVGGRLRHLCAS